MHKQVEDVLMQMFSARTIYIKITVYCINFIIRSGRVTSVQLQCNSTYWQNARHGNT